MEQEGSRELEPPGEDYGGWPLRGRLELLAFDARLAEVPQALVKTLWDVIDELREAETVDPLGIASRQP